MKSLIPLVLVLVLAAGMPAPPAPAQEKAAPGGTYAPVDGVAVIVAGEVITWNDVRMKMGNVKASEFSYPTQEQRERKLEGYAFESLRKVVVEKLQLQVARAEKIRITEEEVDLEFLEKKKQMGSVYDFMKVLSGKGLTVTQYRQNLKENLLRRRYIEANYRNMFGVRRLRKVSFRVSPGKIREYYRKNRDRYREAACVWLRRAHILAERVGGEADARGLGRAVIQDLRSGLTPKQVDKKHGLNCKQFTCPAEDLEAVLPESGLLRSIRTWAFSHEPGAVSDLIELAPGNLVVFYLEKKRKEVVRSFEEVQDQIQVQLVMEKQIAFDRKMLENLVEKADFSWPELKRWILDPGAPRPSMDPAILKGILSKSL